ncbi:MAG TPA: crossover junction endodeoxyribonuclease RuvC [Clostridiales bacterium]|nr:crossover junction endodeoxyribonuclease RuvC [Clostridiales bacterium]
MLVLGIDPGLAILGYGIVEKEHNTLCPIDYGTVNTPAHMDAPQRLVRIFDGVCEIIDYFCPDAVAIEELFFNKNVKTAISIGQARGVAIVAAAKYGLPIYEYTPLQVKQAVVGYGRAEKVQVQNMVKMLLGLKKTPKPDDAADALAIAICHINNIGMYKKLKYR